MERDDNAMRHFASRSKQPRVLIAGNQKSNLPAVNIYMFDSSFGTNMDGLETSNAGPAKQQTRGEKMCSRRCLHESFM